MFPVTVYSHWIWSALIFMAFLAVYRKYQQNQNEMLKNFAMFFLIWSIPFFGLMATMFAAGIYFNMEILLSLGYVIPHIFAFISVGYLWKVQSSINFPKYQKLFWGFVAYGVGIGLFGIINSPEVTLANGDLQYSATVFNQLIPAGMTISGLMIAGSSFYSAYLTKGDTRKKLSLIGVGTVLCLILASMLHNFGYAVAGEITNAVWISIFLVVAYWKSIKNKMKSLRGN